MTKDQFDSAAYLLNGIATLKKDIKYLNELSDGMAAVRVGDYNGFVTERAVVLKEEERNVVLNIIKGYREAELKELKKKFEEI